MAPPSQVSGEGFQIMNISQLFGEDMVTIEIGTGANSKRFLIHKALLCKRVEYFHKLFNSEFREGTKQKATFPEGDIDAWTMMVDWIYRDTLSPLPFLSKPPRAQHRELPTLIKAVALAEKYVIEQFADQLMDAFRSYHISKKYMTETAMVEFCSLHTGPGSKIRLYMARELAHGLCFREVESDWESSFTFNMIKANKNLAFDMLPFIHERAQAKFTSQRVEIRHPACDYHQHSSDVPCPYVKSSDTDSEI